jgi:energy-converting hydrogenase A subunit R
VCELLGLPFASCRCTELSLDGWELPEAEAAWVRERAQWISQQEPITLPDGATSIDDLSSADRATVRALDALFWDELERRAPLAASMIASVHPVGGHGKLAALQDIVAATPGAADVMYVGDSITDVPPFTAVREAGGVALSFNGNRYALAAAELAAAAADTAPTRELSLAFAAGGREAVFAAARDWPQVAKPLPRVGLLAESGPALAHASAYARSHVRGERVARLG